MARQVDVPVITSVIASADPAANTEFSITVPAKKAYELICVTVSLVQGATQTPQPILQITDGTSVLFESFGSSGAQAVSTTCQYTWAPDLQLSAQVGATTAVHSVAPLPAGLVLNTGFVIASVTLGKGANSDYGIARAFVKEYTA